MAKSIESSTGVIVTPNLMVRAGGEILMLSAGLVLWRMTQKGTAAAS